MYFTKNKTPAFLIALLLLILCLPMMALAESVDIQEITVPNRPIKGLIQVQKQGPVLTGFNEHQDPFGNTVHTPLYNKGSLAGATFEVRAVEDIVGKDGTLWFKADEVAASITTNAEGVAETKLLPLGHYYVTEASAPAGYIFDSTRYDVMLEARDRNKFSFMGILLLLIGIALAVTGWIVTQGVTDGIQYIVSAPEDKDALKDAYREAQVLLSSLTDLVDLAVVSGKAQHMTLSTDISETEGTIYAVDLGFFDLRPEALKDGRLISGGDIKDCRDVILIDESTAYQLFPAGDALGKTILLGGQIWTVVGVVKDRARFGEADRSLAYIPITAAITQGQPMQTLEICIRRGKGETPTASLQSALTGWRGGGTFYELSKEKAAARIPLRWCAVILGCCLIRWLLHLLTDWARRQYALLREKLQAQYATRLIGWATGRIVMLLLGFLLAGIAAYAVLSLITKAALIFPEWVPDKPFSPASYVSCFWSSHQNAALSVPFASREKAILLLGARLIRWGCFAWMAGCTIMYLRSFVISKLYNNTMRRKSS